MWGFIFRTLLTLVLSELLRPKPNIENARPAGLGDFNFPTATQGRPVPVIFGRNELTGPNVVWYGDYTQEAITEKIKTGLFSSSQVTKGYRYNVGIQFALFRGSDADTNLYRIKVGQDILMETTLTADGAQTSLDLPDFLGGDDLGQGGMSGTMTWHPGSTTQTADTYLSTFQQQGGDTPAYRGTAYLVWEGGYVGNSANIGPWSFEVGRYTNPLSISNSQIGQEMNPANVIYEILTNTDWGMSQPTADIDTTSFSAAGETLLTEENGFSFVWDTTSEISKLLKEVERQIDGVVLLDPQTGLWIINLFRADYTAASLTLADETNIKELSNYSEGDWAETTNQGRVEFNNRLLEYNTDYAVADNNANFEIQGERIVAINRYPGVKTGDNANNIAWRDLYESSRPLSKANMLVTREFWSKLPGDVIRWSWPALGISERVMRITRVDLGELTNGNIKLETIEDVFSSRIGSFAASNSNSFVAPSNVPVDIPIADRAIIEAPRAFSDRDPVSPGLYNRYWAGIRSQDVGEVQFDVLVDEVNVGTAVAFMLIGELDSSLAPAVAGASVILTSTPDTLVDVQAALSDATDDEIGVNLQNIIMVNDEMMAFTSFTDTDPTTTLVDVQRGLMDTIPEEHSAGDLVYLIHLGGIITTSSFSVASHNVKILPRTNTQTLDTGDATASVVALANRALKPYPPARLQLNSTLFATTADFDTDVSAVGDPEGLQTDYVRRDFRTTNEITAIADESTLPVDFPTNNTTEYRLVVTDDPNGSPVVVYTGDYTDGNSLTVSRTKIIRELDGVVPTEVEVAVGTQHVEGGTTYPADQSLMTISALTSTQLSGSTAFSNTNAAVVRELYSSAPTTGTYVFTVGQAVFDVGTSLLIWNDDNWLSWSDDIFLEWWDGDTAPTLQARLNGGAWETVIGDGTLTGTLAVTSGDQVEIMHDLTGDDTNETLLRVEDGGGINKTHTVLIL